MRGRRSWATAAFLACAFALPACRQRGPRPVCVEETAAPRNPEVSDRELDPRTRFGTMLMSYDWQRGYPGEPARDCLGREVELPRSGSRCPTPSRFVQSERPNPSARLTRDDLYTQPGPDGQLLVWVVARRYPDGDGVGPVALIQWTRRGVAMMVEGPLRAGTRGPSMRIEELGEDQRVLLVESDRCDPAAPEICRPTVEVLPIFTGLVTPTPMTGPDGRCLGPARFDRRRSLKMPMAEGWTREFTLNSDVVIEGGQIIIHEQVIVRDSDPGAEDEPAREFRAVDDTLTLTLDTRLLRVSGPSLWERVLEEDGRVDGAALTDDTR